MKVSASSINSVGAHASTARNNAAAVMLAEGNGRSTKRPNIASTVLFPHRFSGDVIARIGATFTEPITCVNTIHSAERHVRMLGQNHIAPDRVNQIGEQLGAAYRLGPGLDIREQDSLALAVIAVARQFAAGFLDLGV